MATDFIATVDQCKGCLRKTPHYKRKWLHRRNRWNSLSMTFVVQFSANITEISISKWLWTIFKSDESDINVNDNICASSKRVQRTLRYLIQSPRCLPADDSLLSVGNWFTLVCTLLGIKPLTTILIKLRANKQVEWNNKINETNLRQCQTENIFGAFHTCNAVRRSMGSCTLKKWGIEQKSKSQN